MQAEGICESRKQHHPFLDVPSLPAAMAPSTLATSGEMGTPETSGKNKRKLTYYESPLEKPFKDVSVAIEASSSLSACMKLGRWSHAEERRKEAQETLRVGRMGLLLSAYLQYDMATIAMKQTVEYCTYESTVLYNTYSYYKIINVRVLILRG